jgi:hypothetical protein
MPTRDTDLLAALLNSAFEGNQLQRQPSHGYLITGIQWRIIDRLTIEGDAMAAIQISDSTRTAVNLNFQVLTGEKAQVREDNIATV